MILKSRISIYVPSKVGEREIDNTLYVQGAARLLALSCGGATVTDAFGYWVEPGGELVEEHVKVVYAYTNDEESSLALLRDYAQYVRIALSQDAVAIEYSNQLELV